MKRTLAACILLALLAAAPASAAEMGSPRTAALQIALAHKGLYHGTIDGHWGVSTEAAVRRLQRNARIGVDGVPGPRTRRALGKLGRHRFGSRMLVAGKVGWDVSQTQFLLAWHGFPSGPMDGHFGARTTAALRRFQVHAHLVADGVAGPAVFAALRATAAPGSDPSLGADRRLVDGRVRAAREPLPHGARLSGGHGRPRLAAASGRVTQVGWDPAGYGTYVVIRNSRAAYTWYAHLSRVGVSVGQRVQRGQRIGRVGASGSATGPHLHFELRIRRAAVDPSRAL